MADEEEAELSEKQKIDIAKWFLLNSPPGEIQFVAKGIKFLSLLLSPKSRIQYPTTPFTSSHFCSTLSPESQFLILYNC